MDDDRTYTGKEEGEVLTEPVETKEHGGKVITIRTLRDTNVPPYYGFPSDVSYRGHISVIEFSIPVIDFEGRENKKLTLKTAWFSDHVVPCNYWKQWLDDERGYALISRGRFGELKGPFGDYSESKLRSWQEQGLREHKKSLARLETLYYLEEPMIPRDFFHWPVPLPY